jgi:hypothetical protein
MGRVVLGMVVCLSMGCGNQQTPKAESKGVEVNAPGVNVKVGEKGTEVKAPGVNVKAGEKGAAVTFPGGKVKVKDKD